MEEHRGTGRTTRMMQAAIAEASKGRYVFVVMANVSQIQNQKDWVLDEFASVTKSVGGMKIYIADKGGCIQFDTIYSRQFKPESLSFIGAHPKCQVFVDHYAIESRYAKLLSQLHRFDLPATPDK